MREARVEERTVDHANHASAAWTIVHDGHAVGLVELQRVKGLHNTFLVKSEIIDLIGKEYRHLNRGPLTSENWSTLQTGEIATMEDLKGVDHILLFSTREDAEKVRDLFCDPVKLGEW